MIRYVVTQEYFNTVVGYLAAYGSMFAIRPRSIFYDQSARAQRTIGRLRNAGFSS